MDRMTDQQITYLVSGLQKNDPAEYNFHKVNIKMF